MLLRPIGLPRPPLGYVLDGERSTVGSSPTLLTLRGERFPPAPTYASLDMSGGVYVQLVTASPSSTSFHNDVMHRPVVTDQPPHSHALARLLAMTPSSLRLLLSYLSSLPSGCRYVCMIVLTVQHTYTRTHHLLTPPRPRHVPPPLT